jgi:ABC-type uncharacterized transport system auxiliary subunit
MHGLPFFKFCIKKQINKLNIKIPQMKKVFLALAIATVFVACDDSKTKTNSTTTDSLTLKNDTSTIVPIPDSVKVDTSATKMSKDTLKK